MSAALPRRSVKQVTAGTATRGQTDGMRRSRALLGVVFASLATAATAQPPVVPGFPNVPQTAGEVLSGLNAPQQGRTAILAYHNGVLFTVPEVPSSQPGADFLVRTWDLSDPTSPVEVANHGITPMPINAHGYFKSGDYLVLGSNWPPEAPWSWRRTGPGTLERTTFPQLLCAGVRGCLFQPWFVGDTYWSYGTVGGDATISLDGNELASWDHLGETGVIGHPFLVGDLLIFASDQSRTGVATYDVSDPTDPVLLDVLTTGGPGGYWPELWGGDGKLYVVFPYRVGGNGFRVVDVSDPSDLRFVADRALPGDASMYIQFQDEFAFMGGHKVDMRSFDSVLFLDGANVTRPNDGGVGIDTSQFLLPLGNLLVTGGIGPNEGMAIWAHQSTPDDRGPSVGYHIPQSGRTGYPVGAPITLLIHETLESFTIINGTTFIVRPLGGSPIPGRLTFSFDDVLTFTPDAPLAADTTYEVVLPAGGIKDAAGNGIEGYSFTFSTGSTVGGNRPPDITSFDVADYPAEPGGMTNLFATADDPDGDSVEFRFDFGDGSPKTPWSSQGNANHVFAEAGHYRATVQARDPAGSIVSESRTVTVLDPPSAPFPVASSPIGCDATGRLAWVVNPDNDSVAAIDSDTLQRALEVPACADPRSVAVVGDEAWVTCHDDDRVVILDVSTGGLIDEIGLDYGAAPIALAPSPDGASMYVSEHGSGALGRYEVSSRSRTGTLSLGPTPGALAVTGDGTGILVARFLSPPDHAEVWEVSATSFTLNRTIEIPKFGGDENRDGTASGRGTANYLTAIAVSPDGTSAWLTANKPNAEKGPLFAEDLDQDNTVRNLAIRVDLTAGTLDRAVDLDNSDSAHGLAFSPLGDYLFVALQGNNEVLVLDALEAPGGSGGDSGLGGLVARLAVGRAPQGVCVDSDTERVFVKNFLSRDASAVDAGPLFRSGSITLASSTVATSTTEALPPTVLAGKTLFYDASDPRMSAEGYLSCATCHLDGGEDGRVWDFTGRGEGLRNTITLNGRGGMGHGNVHWSANFDEIQDFENDIRFAFGGSGFLSDADFDATSDPLGPPKAGLSAELDALADYLTSLTFEALPRSPHRAANGTLTPSAAAGRAVFAAEGCAGCHSGSEFTDSTTGTVILHDVGTLRTTSGGRLGGVLDGIDTPTLLGIFASAPYLHDGSAPTLEDVFVVAGGEVLPAEDGTPAGGASVVDTWVDLNNDDTVHGRAYMALNDQGARVDFAGIDGGAGGVGAIELRVSSWSATTLSVRVNGSGSTVTVPDPGNDPRWRHTNWLRVRVEGLSFSPGTGNTVTVEATASFPNVSLDEIVVSSPDDLAQAEPHRRVLALSTGARSDLLAYLRQLDANGDSVPTTEIFSDGFESGDTSAWSTTIP